MEKIIREITIREYSGKENRPNHAIPLYEIVEHCSKSFVYSEKQLLECLGTNLSFGLFSKVKLTNELNGKLKEETQEGIEQMVRANNIHYTKYYNEISRLGRIINPISSKRNPFTLR